MKVQRYAITLKSKWFKIFHLCLINSDSMKIMHLISNIRSTVGTLFALPWYLTWFGHSLNSYRNVVRLYDYFLASPHLLPLYVTAAIVLYREDDVFKEDCDMASLHCLLSHVGFLNVFIFFFSK